MDSVNGCLQQQYLCGIGNEVIRDSTATSIGCIGKVIPLLHAKDEAEREATEYRSHIEEEYQKSISENTGSSGSNVKRLEEETNAKIKNLKKSTSKVSSEVVDMLLKYVTNIKT
ncbi:hypothetical protein JHK82_026054 [Glycine max]|nr:hypothetical protein JHK85_026663 [Glycine max]KAG5134866.1 hypothetical protein JHK82_026054 [Glycine max]